MSDTDVRECKVCGHETDCIQGVCLPCSLEDDSDVDIEWMNASMGPYPVKRI